MIAASSLRAALSVGLLVSGCAASMVGEDRSEVIRRILPSTVQLRVEREGGARRTASGVVLASDRASGRSWILTTRHFLDPPASQEIYVSASERRGRVRAAVVAVSPEADLAVVAVEGFALPPVRFRDVVRLGDEVWIVAFPWGRRLTLVSGVVSQIAADEGEMVVEGPAGMVDASVSYGASGGGVFDAASGELVGIVQGYRTARMAIPDVPERSLEVPVPGETTVISSQVIRRFLLASGLDALIPK